MPKRLLILSDAIISPSFSPRLTSMIHYLQQAGWQCTLAADNIAGKEYQTDTCQQINMTYLPDGLSSFRRFRKRVSDKLYFARERQFTAMLLKAYTASDFDLIFCSTFYYFPLWTAKCLSEAWHIPFVVDVRDIAEQWGKTDYFTSPLPKLFGLEKLLSGIYVSRNIRLRNEVLRHATAVTTISPWHQQYLQSLTTAPVSLIYNGYDEQEIQPKDVPTDQFHIAFIGRLLSLQLRQPDLLFQAVSELTHTSASVTRHLSIDFYSEPQLADDLRQLAAQYNISDLLHLHSYIARDEIQDVMSKVSILIALGAPAATQQHGILGTKIFEAIGMEKPFMLIPDDKENLASLIAETGIGIAASTTEDIKRFTLSQYAQWENQGFTRLSIDDKERFSRRYQAQLFDALMTSLIA